MTSETCNHSTFEVRVTVLTRWSLLWMRAMCVLAPLVGADRAMRWARAGAWHFARWRIGEGRWQRFSREERP